LIQYSKNPTNYIRTPLGEIAVFESSDRENKDDATIESFGNEWNKFSSFSEEEIESIGNEYFDIVPETVFGKDKLALDVGCGSGRWSFYVADRFKQVEAVDPSDAVSVAQKMLQNKNARVSKASVDNLPFPDESFDFVFSLGVLHHIPDTAAAMAKSVKKLKKGGWFLVYLYYDLDNRGILYKGIFSMINALRKIIYRLPQSAKKFVCDLIALFIYLPLVQFAKFLKFLRVEIWKKVPLNYYIGKSFFVMRNDALDRFGTPLEQRFSRLQIQQMMERAGLDEIEFSEQQPYWHALGKKV
jgi:ubiquinone/menaquinone biosynthesis C-methylase UbiE